MVVGSDASSQVQVDVIKASMVRLSFARRMVVVGDVCIYLDVILLQLMTSLSCALHTEVDGAVNSRVDVRKNRQARPCFV